MSSVGFPAGRAEGRRRVGPRRPTTREWLAEAEVRSKQHQARTDLQATVERGPSTRSMRVKNALTYALALGGIFLLQHLIWTHPRHPSWLGGEVWAWLGLVWCLPLPIALFMIIGFLTYRRPNTPIERIDTLVSWRFASRGENAEILRSAIESVHRCMAQAPLFPYEIEVVTDSVAIDLSDLDVIHYVVPLDYQTPNKSRYKARALHYAVESSHLPPQAWIMHCDEESHATPSLVAGIAQAVREEERTGRHRIGQGVVLYHNQATDHPLMLMADMTRSGDDISRFSAQSNLFGLALFGFHGSFILVRNSVATDVGYDFGPKGSVTEDAFWALAQMDRGRRCRFVDGYMIEQAPQSVMDFLKQRRRWFLGLFETVLHAPARLRFRAPLGACIAIWSFSWMTVFYTAFNLIIGYKTPWQVRIGGNVVFASYVSMYLIGMRLNLENWRPGRLRSVLWMAGQLLAVPIASIFECLGIVYGFLSPDLGFHVITKNPKGAQSAVVQATAQELASPHPLPAAASAPQPLPSFQTPSTVAAAAALLPQDQLPELEPAWSQSAAGWLQEELQRLEQGEQSFPVIMYPAEPRRRQAPRPAPEGAR